jgi:YfiH family protein
MNLERLVPDWPAPPQVRACMTTRHGGVSRGPYASLNLGDHVGDDPAAVAANRTRLLTALELPGEPLWLQQVHGCGVARAGRDRPGCQADATLAQAPGQVCGVLTADCLPLLFCDRAGQRVAAAHAGWRGLCDGVIEAALDALAVPGEQVLCWLGPAIGPEAFEVGPEVRAAFLARDPGAAAAFRPSPAGRWLADLYHLARRRLAARGVGFVGGGEHCTFTESERFFSYRRDGVTGRLASLIWLV